MEQPPAVSAAALAPELSASSGSAARTAVQPQSVQPRSRARPSPRARDRAAIARATRRVGSALVHASTRRSRRWHHRRAARAAPAPRKQRRLDPFSWRAAREEIGAGSRRERATDIATGRAWSSMPWSIGRPIHPHERAGDFSARKDFPELIRARASAARGAWAAARCAGCRCGRSARRSRSRTRGSRPATPSCRRPRTSEPTRPRDSSSRTA